MYLPIVHIHTLRVSINSVKLRVCTECTYTYKNDFTRCIIVINH